jgi:Lar family restriction alleviation protein
MNPIHNNPCPFCGGGLIAILEEIKSGGRSVYRGYCFACHAQGPPEKSEDLAITLWNRRTPPMADTPVPGGVERNVVKPPNEVNRGDRRNNGFLPLTGGGTAHPPNHGPGGDRRMGSFPLSDTGSGITPPNHEFEVGMARMPQPPSAMEPGKGAVPVGPYGSFPVAETRRGK